MGSELDRLDKSDAYVGVFTNSKYRIGWIRLMPMLVFSPTVNNNYTFVSVSPIVNNI